METQAVTAWTRRLGAAGLLMVTVLVASLSPAAAATHPRDTPPTDPGFVWPPPGQVTYAPAGDFNVSWNAGDLTPTAWSLVRSSGAVDPNGRCDSVTWLAEAPIQTPDATPGVVVPGQLADACYEFAVSPSDADPALPPTYQSGAVRVLTAWTGSYDLYRHGVFASQAEATWCVGASIEMMLNIIQHTRDHSATDQRTYLSYARRKDLYVSGAHHGTDAQGWSASLAHFGGGDGYHQVSNPRYKASIRAAVRRLRQTGKPVGLIVAHSNHAWVLTGFEATTDPGLDFTAQITALYVMGPLWPRHTNKDGFDPAPDTRLTFDQLRAFHTRYYDSSGADNPWEGTFVSILP